MALHRLVRVCTALVCIGCGSTSTGGLFGDPGEFGPDAGAGAAGKVSGNGGSGNGNGGTGSGGSGNGGSLPSKGGAVATGGGLSGGATASGGKTGTGGMIRGAGGVLASGGRLGGGGTVAGTGGKPATGGIPAAGGKPATGGRAGSGGLASGGTGMGGAMGDGGAVTDSGMQPTPNSVACGAMPCDVSASNFPRQGCCILPFADSNFCIPFTMGMTTCEQSGGTLATCDDAADCASGQVCCADPNNTATPTACATTCDNGFEQLCRTDAECRDHRACIPLPRRPDFSSCR